MYQVDAKTYDQCLIMVQGAQSVKGLFYALQQHGEEMDVFHTALLKAADEYDASYETKFTTLFMTVFRNTAINVLKSLDREFERKFVPLETDDEDSNFVENYISSDDEHIRNELQFAEVLCSTVQSINHNYKYLHGIKAKVTEALDGLMSINPFLLESVRESYQKYSPVIDMKFANFYHSEPSETLYEAVAIPMKKESEIDNTKSDEPLTIPFQAFVYKAYLGYSDAEVTRKVMTPLKDMLEQLNRKHGDVLSM